MSKVTIYRFKLYNITIDESRESRRWATLEAIERIHGEVLKDTATQVDASAVATDEAGMTVVGFDPHPRIGFQTAI
jgi:uncharacterized protein with FMN-binding domain